jgi:hypothetical protein
MAAPSFLCKLVSRQRTSAFERGSLALKDLPQRQGGRGAVLVGLPVDQMAFEAEVIVDAGVDLSELQ